MTIHNHPSAELRQAYAEGALSPGASLALESHLALCPVCALSVESLGRGRRWRRPGNNHGKRDAAAAPSASAQAELRASLEARRAGPWRRLSGGVRIAALAGASGLGEAVYLIEADPGASLRAVSAGDVEYVLVLSGGVAGLSTLHEAGDLVAAPRTALEEATAHPQEGACGLVVSVDSWPRSLITRLLLRRDAMRPLKTS